MNEIEKTQFEIYELTQKLKKLQANTPGEPVKNYEFQTRGGMTTLKDLIGNKKGLYAIHNMGQGCRYCTLWADGLNGFIPHLESQYAIVLLSKDSPEIQHQMANDRGWRFTMASHGGGSYIKEQTVKAEADNYPGVVYYELSGDKILRKNHGLFGPGDLFCSLWHLLNLAGADESTFTPQFSYWLRPQKLDDGGENINDG